MQRFKGSIPQMPSRADAGPSQAVHRCPERNDAYTLLSITARKEILYSQCLNEIRLASFPLLEQNQVYTFVIHANKQITAENLKLCFTKERCDGRPFSEGSTYDDFSSESLQLTSNRAGESTCRVDLRFSRSTLPLQQSMCRVYTLGLSVFGRIVKRELVVASPPVIKIILNQIRSNEATIQQFPLKF